MMKRTLFLLIVTFSNYLLHSQNIDTVLLQRGIRLYLEGRYDSSSAILFQCLKQAEAVKDSTVLQSIYTNIGNIYASTGKMELSLNYYQKGLHIAERTRDTVRQARILNNIGTIYSDQKDFKNALEYFEKAIELAEKVNDQETLADCANGEAVIYEQTSDFERALNLYKKALGIYKKLNLEDRIALAYNNIGIVYKQLNNLSQTAYYYQKALEIAERIDAQYIVAALHANLANVYMLQKQYSKAIQANNKAMQKAREIGAQNICVEVYGNLMDLYAASDDYGNAYRFAKLYKESNDSLINIERSSHMAEMKEKYESEKKEAENIDLKNRNQIKSLQLQEQTLKLQKRSFLLIGSILILILGGLAIAMYIFWQKAKHKILRERIIRDTEEQERMRISRDLHDDLGSGLSKMKLLSEITFRRAHDQEVRKNIQQLSDTVSNIAATMKDMVWSLNPENTTIDHLIAKIRENSFEYLEDLPIKLQFTAPEAIPPKPVSKEINSNILFILKECLQNIVKHSQAKKVCIDIQLSEKTAIISVRDDGIGIKSGAKSGNGLNNIKQRISKIGGSARIVSGESRGVTIQLEF